MRLVRYKPPQGPPRPAVMIGEILVDVETASQDLGLAMPKHLEAWPPHDHEQLTELMTLADILRNRMSHGTELPGAVGPARDVSLATPLTRPSKILCVGLNYTDHIAEVGLTAPSRPHVFSKLPSAMVGPTDDIVVDENLVSQLDHEVELAVVVGRPAHSVTPDDAWQHILGYTIANDMTARDWQFGGDDQLTLGKGFDNFFPMGPVIVTRDELAEPDNLDISCTVNGETRQHANTSQMVFPVNELVSFLSSICTLLPGDVIATGTPAGVGFGQRPQRFLDTGDVITCEIEHIGRLTNAVVRQPTNGGEE